MYLLINLQHMQVLHAHHDVNTVANLAVIECGEDAYTIAAFDNIRSLYTWTEMELRSLYRNLCGQETKQVGNNLRALVVEALSRVAPSDVNRYEADKQADFCEGKTFKDPVRYVRGANKPSVGQVLFKQCEPATDESAAVLAGKNMVPRVKVVAEPTAAPAPSNAVGGAKPWASTPATAPSGPAGAKPWLAAPTTAAPAPAQAQAPAAAPPKPVPTAAPTPGKKPWEK